MSDDRREPRERLPRYAIQDQATQDHMLVAAATLAPSLARQKYSSGWYALPPPGRERLRLRRQQARQDGAQDGIIYQNDKYGQDGLTGYKESITAYHLDDVGQKFPITRRDRLHRPSGEL